jgi:hypothetical protein
MACLFPTLFQDWDCSAHCVACKLSYPSNEHILQEILQTAFFFYFGLDELRCAGDNGDGGDNGDNGGDGGSNIEFILRLHYLVFIIFCIVVFLLGKF